MIHFKSVTLKNFLAFGDNPTVFELNRHASTLISGKNATGKTSIMSAICYSLFGKTERGVPQRGLINTVNQKDSWAKVTFQKGHHEYTVLRGQKPARLEITKDGNLLNEDAAVRDTQKFIEQLLGFDFGAFLRVVFLSTMDYRPFLQLTAHERRNFVETMLDLKDFSEMNRLHKQEQSRLTEELNTIERNVSINKALYNEKKNTLELLQKIDGDRVEQTKKELNELVAQMEEKTDEASKVATKIDNLKTYIKELEVSVSFTQKHIASINNSITVNRSQIKHLKAQQDLLNVSKCESCKQDIDAHHAETIVAQLDSGIAAIENDIAILESDKDAKTQELNTKSTEHKTLLNDKSELEKYHNSLLTSKSIITADVKKKIASINKNVDTSQIDSIKVELAELKDNLKQSANLYDEKYKQIKVGKTVSVLLNDSGIKASIIKEYIPILVASVNNYLQKLNIAVKFNMDEEFNETIITRYSNEYSYGNLSAGERARIDLAMVFAWREVAKLKGSVYSSILVLDEILDASLDTAGTDDAMNILEELTNNGDTFVFIISHRGAIDERCRSIIQLEKVNGFSRIVKT